MIYGNDETDDGAITNTLFPYKRYRWFDNSTQTEPE